jgi:hypothetical protein
MRFGEPLAAKITTNMKQWFAIIFSGYPAEVKTQKEKLSYCQKMNASQGYTEPGLMLSPQNVKDNKIERDLWKSVLNHSIGRLSENHSKNTKILVNNHAQLVDAYFDPKFDVISVNVLNANTLEILRKPKKEFVIPNLSGNSLLYLHILAVSRIYMHRMMLKLLEKKMTVIHLDIDALIYEKKIGEESPLPLGNGIGEFKFEYPNTVMLDYVSLGPRTYSLVYRNEDGTISNKVKVKSFCLDSKDVKSQVNHSLFGEMLDATLNDVLYQIPIAQKRHRRKNLASIKKKLEFHYLGNRLTRKRIFIRRNNEFTTYPYGTKYLNKEAPFVPVAADPWQDDEGEEELVYGDEVESIL